MVQKVDRPAPAQYTSGEDAMVRVFVGPERKEFWVHKALICSESAFFQACVGKSNFEEGVKREVSLPEDSASAFGFLMNCMYRHQIGSIKDIEHEEAAAQAYLLSDKLSMTRYQDLIMTAIMKQKCKYGKTEFTQLIQRLAAEGFRPKLPLWGWYIRRAANLYAHAYHASSRMHLTDEEESLIEDGGPLALEIVKDMMYLYGCSGKRGPICLEEYCNYHVHKYSDECACGMKDKFIAWAKPLHS